ncbi:iron export ABC transporter permease subunit FetB [Erwinia sp. 9145]|uniref:iron efflux ABC transporter permease subunit FetB n=1 Tax=Erwinia sp. 9145 TaxID=1500895 RepID=UPI000553745B|nr:iron export ABC transporter permease subunit FetB [Erwinia sp. 9145]
MNQPDITTQSLGMALMLVAIALAISAKERLGLGRDILWSVFRAVVQLLIVGAVLKMLFAVSNVTLTVAMVLFICLNAALNARKRSQHSDRAFAIAFLAITASTVTTLMILTLSRAIHFVPGQVIPLSGMIAGNAMVAVGLCFSNLDRRFYSDKQQIMEKLALGASVKLASAEIVRDSIRAALIPTVDAAKTVGLVSLPGMMSGLIFAGIDPLLAIKYQIMVTFMLLGTASLATVLTAYLTSRRFYTPRAQLRIEE